MAMSTLAKCACSNGCYLNLREDRRHGLIYGPYGETVTTPPAAQEHHPFAEHPPTWRLISMARWCGLSNSCAYCGAPLPRGRAARLLAAHPN